MSQRRLRVEVVILVTIFFLGAMGRASAGPRPIELAAAINLQHYLTVGDWLAGDYPLDVYAQHVAEHLADVGVLHHSDIGSLLGCQWGFVGENIGVGPDIASIVNAWTASPTHLANIAGDFDHLGVGLVERDGRLWAVAIFAK